ncbi:MAG TPA: response regulator [Thermoplasmata archaeon]|nr:response regulator [Thermoplasmata archaeon]
MPARDETPTTHEILLVEDNPADVRLIKEAFQEAAIACDFSIAADGEEALTYLQRKGAHTTAPRPALILLDLNLPRLDGRELLAIIKRDPQLKNIPVVVLTSSQAEQDISKSYDSYANCYVTKPVNLDDFIEVVKAIHRFWLAVARLPRGGLADLRS